MGKRLTKNDWVNCGLSCLTNDGHTSLRAEHLAQVLNVSRGSFYWHFSDMADFELQLMNEWRQRTTLSVITELEKESSPKARLVTLLSLAMSDDLTLDKAMRSWSMVDKRANKILAEVDNQRIDYIESLLHELDINKNEIELRASVLYWSYIGKSLIGHGPSFSATDVKRLVAIFSR